MSSRFLVGLGAWLLGAVTATGGSMIAVNVMAHGLLDAQAQQLGSTSVSADFEPGSSNSDASPAAGASPSTRVRPTAVKATRSANPSSNAASSGSESQSPSNGSSPSPAGTLLVSSGGSVMATCEPAGAYLLYWSPDQGFEAQNVYRGPAAIASVLFQGAPGTSVVMQVSCSGSTPVAHVYQRRDE